MNFKHVLFSGLILSAGLTACSNEELISSTEVAKDAIELGSDFTITGSKVNFVGSRSQIDAGTLKPYWEEKDTIGAAWYNAVTAIAEDGAITSSSLNNFYSNHPFAWLEMVGDKYNAKFQSRTNAFAGAYVLYYPYNSKVASVQANIPVAVGAEQIMDCTVGKELDAINKNMFSYGVAKFIPGGNQTAEFTLGQVPVLYQLKFKVEDQNMLELVNGLTIEKVIIEVKKSNATSLFKEGTVTPITSAVDYTKDLVKATYAGATAVTQYILNVENPTDDYKITALGDAGATKKAFYFAGLPATAASDEYTFRILTSDGQVFSREYKASVPADKAIVDALNAKGGATSEGGLVKLNVTVKLSDDAIIYTPEQFTKALAKAASQPASAEAAKRTLTLGAGLELEDISLNVEGADVIIAGESLSAKSLTVTKGTVTVNKGAKITDATVGVYGNLVATAAAITVTNLLNVEGEANVKVDALKDVTLASRAAVTIEGAAAAKAITGTLANSGNLTLKTIILKGATTNQTAGTIILGDATVSNAGTFTNNGTLTVANDFTNKGIFTLGGTTTPTSGKIFTNDAGATLKITKTVTNLKITNAAATPKAAAAVINIEMADKASFDATDKLTNSGIINVTKGTLEESAANGIAQTGDAARINLSANAVLTFASGGTTAIEGYVMWVKDATITNAVTGTLVAYAAAKPADITTLGASVNTIFVGGTSAWTVDAATATELAKYNLVLNQSLALASAVTVGVAKTFTVAGDVKITAALAQNLILATNTVNEVIKGAKLTIGKDVTFKGDVTAGSTLTTNNNLFSDGGIITAGAAGANNITITNNN